MKISVRISSGLCLLLIYNKPVAYFCVVFVCVSEVDWDCLYCLRTHCVHLEGVESAKQFTLGWNLPESFTQALGCLFAERCEQNSTFLALLKRETVTS